MLLLAELMLPVLAATEVVPTPALLALRRFIRGPLRQFSLGLVSFVLVFGLTAYLPAVAGHTPVEQPSRSAVPSASAAAEVPDAQRLETFGRFDLPGAASDSAATRSDITAKPRRVLSPKMTGHRLTGARLSLPLTNKRAIASISEDS